MTSGITAKSARERPAAASPERTAGIVTERRKWAEPKGITNSPSATSAAARVSRGPRAEGTQVDRRRPEEVGPWIERRRHQGVPIELAAKIQLFACLPGRKNRTQSPDQLDHSRNRTVEGTAVPLLDLSAYLRPQSQHKAARREKLVVVGLVCQLNWVARESNCHVGHEVESADRGGQRQRGKHVVRTFEGEHTAGACVAQGTRAIDRIGGPEEGGQDLHCMPRIAARTRTSAPNCSFGRPIVRSMGGRAPWGTWDTTYW